MVVNKFPISDPNIRVPKTVYPIREMLAPTTVNFDGTPMPNPIRKVTNLKVPKEFDIVQSAVKAWTEHAILEITCDVCHEKKYVHVDHHISYGSTCEDCIGATKHVFITDAGMKCVCEVKEDTIEDILQSIEHDKDFIETATGKLCSRRTSNLVTGKARSVPEYIIVAD